MEMENQFPLMPKKLRQPQGACAPLSVGMIFKIMVINMKNYFSIVLIALLIETSLTGAAHGEIRKKIDETTARRLLKQAYGKTGRGSFDYDAGMGNHFYEYAGVSPP